MWSTQLKQYFSALKAPDVPQQYEVMNPYAQPETMSIVDQFLSKYLHDDRKRVLLFGINPGRFGSGITGISFTDPIRLKETLGIDHPFEMRPELSSAFIYEAIEAFGGPARFYRDFFISAVYPLGFLHDGKNINYYELKDWKDYMIQPIVDELNTHMKWPIQRDVAVCIGKGENFKVLKALNKEHGWFDRIEVLPHPRWILQYRRREKMLHLDAYLKVLSQFSS
jgi:hypothetical protein